MFQKAMRGVACLLVAALAAGMTVFPRAVGDESDQKESAVAVPVTENAVLKNDRLSLHLDVATGFFTVADSDADMTYASNPEDYGLDMVAQGVNITRMVSQLLVTFLNESNTVDEVNSYVGSSSEGGLAVSRRDDTLILTYTFPEQQFVIPLECRLTDDSLVVTIDYDHIREDGGCRILNITLLPFFGAARSGDKGAFIIPDGSGAYVGFNNGRFAQGEYRREIYSDDLTQQSQAKPNDYKPVLLPLFAGLYTHVVPPLEESDDGTEPEQQPGRDVQAGFLAVIREGAAGSEVAVSVAGYDTGYNTAGFTFLYRTSMETTLLSRTWAEIKRVMAAEGRARPQNPQVEYRFLKGEEATIKGAADAYAALLLEGETRGDSRNDALYLDITASVRTQHQFLGFGYQDITPLTTLQETEDILTALREKGLDRFVVRLRGLDSSGAYYGRIDSQLSVDKKVGSEKQLRALTETWGDIYPEVQLTQFTRNGNGVHSFFDSVTAVNKKTAKLFDYHLATGLRDYDRPTRYLLRPDKVEAAAEKLKADLAKKELTTLAPTSLAQDLYSNFGGGIDSIGQVQERFTALLAGFSGDCRLLLEAPNAYAIPYADNLLSLPHSDSGHFISDGAIPFLQLVLDGLRGYSLPAANYAADPHTMLLHAVESNSALSYSVIAESYSAVARTSLNSLYASDFTQWEEDIVSAAKEMAQVRERTESSAVSQYEFLDSELRRVTFSNGTVILINYDTVARTADGVSVEAKSYCFVDGREGG